MSQNKRATLKKIIKRTELFRMSNYVGRDKSFFDKLCGLDKLLNDVMEWHTSELELYKEYIELLGAELDEVCMIATVHGWKSKRWEQGKESRS